MECQIDMPDRMSEDMTDRMPEDMPDRISNRMPVRLPEGLPDRVSDGMNSMPWWGSLEAKCFFEWNMPDRQETTLYQNEEVQWVACGLTES